MITSIHDPALAFEYADIFLFFKDHRIISLLTKEDEDFRERFSKAISVLYNNEVEISFREGRISIDPVR